MFNRVSNRLSIHLFAVSLLIVAITTVSATASWTDYFNPFAYIAETETAPLAVAGASAMVIGTCDTAGPIEVESTLPSGPTAYATLSAAFVAINAGTHQGAINVEVCANSTETGATVLNSSGAGSANYTSISIRPLADGLTISGPTVSGRGLIELNGADNVTIDGDNPNSVGTNRNLTITNTASSTTTYTSVVRIALSTLITTGSNNSIKNLILNGNATGRNISTATSTTGSEHTTHGILVGGGASTTSSTTAPSAITSVGTTIGSGIVVGNLTIENNQFDAVARGIQLNGSATSVAGNLSITNNVIGNSSQASTTTVYSKGIAISGFDTGSIANNSIQNIQSYLGTAIFGIHLGDASSSGQNLTVERNRISRIANQSTGTWGVQGIVLGAGGTNTVQNNFISDLTHNMSGGTAFGSANGINAIRVSSGTGHKIFHNSVSLYGALAGTASSNHSSSCLYINATSLTGLDVRNNIFSNTISGGTTSIAHVSIMLPSGGTSSMNLTSNNNDYYSGVGAGQGIAHVGTSFGTLYTAANFNASSTSPATNFRSYSSTLSSAGTNDNSSKVVDPAFVSATSDLHIQSSSTMESAGANAGVTNDFDGDSRGGTPDIGADEISLAGPGTVQFSATSYTSAEGNNVTITVNRTGGSSGAISVDYAAGGGTATGGASCTAGVDYITPTPGTFNWADTDAAAKTFNVQLCADNDVETESLNLTLSNPVGTSITGTNPVPLNITDNPPGTIQFSSTTYAGDEGTVVVVTATRNGGSGGAVSVNYASSDATAAAGTCGSGGDYVAASGTLNWANGDSASKTFNLTLCTDLLTSEGAETVNLTLSSPTGGASIGANNPAVLTINDAGIIFCNGGTPIPIADAVTNQSTIAVSSLSGTINTVKVRLNNLSHTFGSDIDVLLVGPNGEKYVIMSDALGSTTTTNATITLADSAATLVPTSALSTGSYSYRPTNYTTGDTFAAPAPAGPYQDAANAGTATFASVFAGANPNGNWNLYVYDDGSGDTGSFAGGWCLEFTLNPPSPGTVQLNPSTYTPSEGVVQTVTVTRTSGTAGAVSVDYSTGGGTATPGTCGTDDYVATSGTLNWADGDGAAKTFNVTTCSDAVSDPGETIDITLSNATGGVSIGGTNPGLITITDIPPPLNGDYTIPGSYATLTAAVADYNLRGVSGPVRFLLGNTTYDTGSGETFPLVIATTGPDTTATNTLTIRPNAGITSAIVGSSASGIVVIGDQFVTINGDNVGGDVARNLTVNNTATAANSYVVGLFNFGGTKVARNATVRYSNIRGGVTAVGTVSWGIILNGSGGDYDNVLIENNKIWQAYVGIGHYGVAATGINNNNIIRNNIIGDTTGSNESIKLRGIEVTQSSGLTIDGNDVFGLPAGNSNSTQAGILLSTGGANNTVTRNNIHDFYYTGTGGLSTHGILISENGGTTNITNNFIHNIKADGDVFNTATNILWMPAGITISGTTTGTLNIDHNSIYMSGATLGSSFTGNSACFSSVAGVTGVNFRNNALRNSMTTVGAPDPGNKTYAIATIGAGSLGTMFSAIDNNTYFVNGTNPNTGTFGQTDRVNLAAFQAATTQDASSQDVDPQFVSTIDLHLSNPLNTVVGGGTPLAGVTVDYDSDPRPALSPDIGADEIVQAEGGSIAAGSYYNAALATGETIGGNVTVNNRLYLNGVIDPGVNTLTMGCGASVVGGGPTSYISGAMTKNYCGAENFTFPVGMGGFYSPANVDVTAVGVNPSSLTVRPHDALLVGFDPLETLSRNWQLDEVGDITANLQFFYDDSDVNGNESDYRMWRREGTGTDTNLCAGGPCVDTVNNILGPVNGVTTFSRWTGSKPLAPTSSAASVSGRVVTANGQGIRGAAIVITGNSLPTPIIVKTGSLGYFQADNLDTGQTYVVTIVSKRFTFSQPSRVINLTDSISDVDFVANPLE